MSKIFFLSLIIAVIVAVMIISLVQFCQSTLAHQVDTKNPAYFYRPPAAYSADLIPSFAQNKIFRVLCAKMGLLQNATVSDYSD